MNTSLPARYTDLIENPSPRCACMLVLDNSYSMSGQPIAQLNAGLQQFFQEVQNDEFAAYSVEVGVVTTANPLQETLPITPVHQIEGFADLTATGATPLATAIDTALASLERRKNEYKQNGVAYYQPWLVIISDGEPTDIWQNTAIKARSLADQRKLVSLPIGVENANVTILSEFSNRPAKLLSGLKFSEFFQWLSASMAQVSRSASTSGRIDLPATSGWDSI